MRWEDLMKPLVDVQPAFDALPCLDDPLVTPEAAAFLRAKLRECVKTMKGAAKHIEQRLKDDEIKR
jgi:hypothetical protein